MLRLVRRRPPPGLPPRGRPAEGRVLRRGPDVRMQQQRQRLGLSRRVCMLVQRTHRCHVRESGRLLLFEWNRVVHAQRLLITARVAPSAALS